MFRSRWYILAAPVIALIFEALPYGAVLNFGSPTGETIRATFSYFSLTPFGYANFGPFITALLSVLLLVAAVVFAFCGRKRWLKCVLFTSWIAAVVSVTPILYGMKMYSFVGMMITVMLVLEGLTAAYMLAAQNKGDAI